MAFATLFILAACAPRNPVNAPANVTPEAWDTAFAIAGASFRNDTGIARSVVSKGNNYRLCKFIEKANGAGTVRIGFIGGSITGGAMASDAQHDFASLFCGHVAKLFPRTTVVQINAGVGGTNSRFGCSRVHDDLLAHDPDLVVVEFAVNDDPSDTFTTMAAMEGIVRQCLQAPDVPVIMLFLMNRSGDTVDQDLHSRVGMQYGLPLISYRNECWPLVAAGIIPLDSLFADAIHPNNRGHQLLAFLLFSFLVNTMRGNTPDNPIPVAQPLITDLYQYASIQRVDDTCVSTAADAGWTPIVKEYSRTGYWTVHAGDSMCLSTSVRELTVGYQLSLHTSSRVQITLDGATADTISSFFLNGWEGGMMELNRIYLQDQAGPHTVRFKSLDNDTFCIDYVLYAP
jgi:lysophospholipase L1-like esterase